MSKTPDPQSDPPRQQGISLNELTEAFAEVMGTEAKTDDVATDQREAKLPPDQADSCPVSPRSILEAMLFVGDRDGQPLAADGAAELMRGVEAEEIPALVDELNRQYDADGRPYRIVSQRHGYRLVLREAFHSLRSRFYGRIREARLSQAAIDVLAIVAYQQPLSGDQISRLRGKPSSHVLAQLVRRGLLRIERKQTKRRTAEYFTTDRFLQLFGLESLEDLPQSEELDRV